MLLPADMAYPAPAYIPPVVPRKSLAALVEAGLVDLLPGHLFRLHGLEDERTKRAQAATRAVPKRVPPAPQLGPKRDPDGFQDETEARDETKAEASDARADLDAFLLVRRRAPSPKQRAVMDRYVATFDVTGPQRAEKLILSHPDDPIGALIADLDGFRQERLAAAEKAESKPRPRRGISDPVTQELARLLADRKGAA